MIHQILTLKTLWISTKNLLQNSCMNNPLRFRKNILERIEKLIITTDDKIIDEKLGYGINKK